MDTKTMVSMLIKALDNQEYSFNDALYSGAFIERFDYQTGAKKIISETLQSVNKHIVSYEHIDKSSFDRDIRRFQQNVDERMLIAWGYKSGSLSIVGIMYADNLSDSEISKLFSKLDDGVTNIMRNHTGHVAGGNDGGTYGTMFLVFSDSNKASHFNNSIRDFYSSHFFKSTYISAMCLDCSSETLTQGKAAFGASWQGGMDVASLRRQLFS